MLHKKITRKEFLLGALSVVGLVLASKIPAITNRKDTSYTKRDQGYGTFAYGGKKKNV